MTCIVGLEHKGKVYIGGDSAGVSGYSISTRLDEKVFVNGPFIMGFTGSFRIGQLLRYSFKPPKHPVNKDDMSYLVTDFVDAARKCYKAKGSLYKNNGDVESFKGPFLLGYKGHLYYVGSDFQIGRVADGYDCVGCGAEIASGAMYVTSTMSAMTPQNRIEWALRAAEHFSSGVRAPFKVLVK